MSLPYYKRFPRDFLEATIGFSLELKGAYAIVLDLIYMRGGRLPDDPQYIAGQLGCSVRKWNSLRAELVSIGKLSVENGLISNSRADVLLEETRTFREKQAENRSHPNKNKAEQSPKPDHTEPDTDKDTIANAIVAHTPVEQPKRAGSPKSGARGSRIPANWTPTPKDYAFASSEGLNREEINREADRFRDYWTAASGRNACKLDWEATWRNWLRSDFRKPSKSDVATTVNAPRGAFDRVISRLDEGTSARHQAGPADYSSDDGATIDGVFSAVSQGASTSADWFGGGGD